MQFDFSAPVTKAFHILKLEKAAACCSTHVALNMFGSAVAKQSWVCSKLNTKIPKQQANKKNTCKSIESIR